MWVWGGYEGNHKQEPTFPPLYNVETHPPTWPLVRQQIVELACAIDCLTCVCVCVIAPLKIGKKGILTEGDSYVTPNSYGSWRKEEEKNSTPRLLSACPREPLPWMAPGPPELGDSCPHLNSIRWLRVSKTHAEKILVMRTLDRSRTPG